jgi:hypothetical protein
MALNLLSRLVRWVKSMIRIRRMKNRDLQILRRYRRSLLLRLEHPHRSALENHVHRTPRLGNHELLNVRIGISRDYLWRQRE